MDEDAEVDAVPDGVGMVTFGDEGAGDDCFGQTSLLLLVFTRLGGLPLSLVGLAIALPKTKADGFDTVRSRFMI
jgi:hypothetical protein